MAIINRDYLVVVDVKQSTINFDKDKIMFYITDKNTSNIFVNLVTNISNNEYVDNYVSIEDAQNYKLTMQIVKPDNTYKIIEAKLLDEKEAIYEFNLEEECKDQIGSYTCDIQTSRVDGEVERIITSNRFLYKVKASVLNDLDSVIESAESYPIVVELFDKLSYIERYEDERQANEEARCEAEEQRQSRYDGLIDTILSRIQSMDDKLVEAEERLTTKEQEVDNCIEENITKIDAKIQETDDKINELDSMFGENLDAINDKIDETNAKLVEMDKSMRTNTSKIDAKIDEANDVIDEMKTSIKENTAKVDAKLEDVEERISTKETEVDNYISSAKTTLNTYQNTTTNRIDNYLKDKSTALDKYQANKDIVINNKLNSALSEIDEYKTQKDVEIDEHLNETTEKLNEYIDNTTNRLDTYIDETTSDFEQYMIDKDAELDAYKDAKDIEIDKALNDYELAKNKEIQTYLETKAKELDDYKDEKDAQINEILDQYDDVVEAQNQRITEAENIVAGFDERITNNENNIANHEERITNIEAEQIVQNARLDNVEYKNMTQDEQIVYLERKARVQAIYLQGLMNDKSDKRVTDEYTGNEAELISSVQGYAMVNEIDGQTLVNETIEPDKELVLNDDIDTSGDTQVTITNAVDNGKVDVVLEGNTMVNVCDQKDAVAITKSYTVESGNHVALQGECDGKCRPNIYGDTLVNLHTNTSNFPKYESNSTTVYSSDGVLTTTVESAPSWQLVNYGIPKIDMIKPSTDYTVIFEKCEGINSVVLMQSNATNVISNYGVVTNNIAVITTVSDFTGIDTSKVMIYGSCKTTYPNTILSSMPILLEGDYTDKPIPNYFEGLQSSFEDGLVPKNLITSENIALTSSEAKFEATYSHDTYTLNYKSLDTFTGDILPCNILSISGLNPNKQYTISFYSNVACTASIQANNTSLTTGDIIISLDVIKGYNIFNFTSNTYNYYTFRIQSCDADIREFIFEKFCIIEGTHDDYDSANGGKYRVDVKVTGKNKFDVSKIIGANRTTTSRNNNVARYNNPIKLKPNTTYIATSNIFNSAASSIFITTSSTEEASTPDNGLSTTSRTITTDETGNIYVMIRTDKGGNNNYIVPTDTDLQNGTYWIQLEEGTTATSYESYKGDIKTYYLNSPLLEGDYIADSGSNVVHVHNYKQLTLDGSNDEGWKEESYNVEGYHCLYASSYSIGKDASTWLCDKFKCETKSSTKGYEYVTNTENGSPEIITTKTIDEFKTWLQSNPVNICLKLKTPTYETISTNDSVLMDSYVNGLLDVDSAVPVDKVVFVGLPFNLKYLYSNTEYNVQFESDNVGNLAFSLGGKTMETNLFISKGINKVTCITNDLSSNSKQMYFNGIGFNVSNIVVTQATDNDFGYFDGMKSVGECEGNELRIVAQSKNVFDINNVILNKYQNYMSASDNWVISENTNFKLIQLFNLEPNTSYYVGNIVDYLTVYDLNDVCMKITLKRNKNYITTPNYRCNLRVSVKTDVDLSTYQVEKGTTATDYVPHQENQLTYNLTEPLRAVGDVKDKFVKKSGKWYIERNCGEVTFNGSEPWASPLGTYIEINDTSFKAQHLINTQCICEQIEYYNIKNTTDFSSINFACVNSNLAKTGQWRLYAPTCTSLDEYKTWLSNNNLNVTYVLATPTYEEITDAEFITYLEATHISNNSNIPCNMVVKNTGYPCLLKPNTDYTILTTLKGSGTLGANIGGGTKLTSDTGKIELITPSTLVDEELRLYGSGLTSSNVKVLEGKNIDTNLLPTSLHGIENAFDDNVAKVRSAGRNILNPNKFVENKSISQVGNNTYQVIVSNYVNAYETIFKNLNLRGTITLTTSITSGSYNGGNLLLYDKFGNKFKEIAFNTSQSVTCETLDKIDVYIPQGKCTFTVQIEKGTEATDYVPYKEEVAQVQLNSPLLKGDKLISRADSVYHVHNYAMITLDGSESWTYTASEDKFGVYNLTTGVKLNGNQYCDKRCTYDAYANNYNEFEVGNEYIRVHAPINIHDEATWKSYLQENPITIVYELASPWEEEVETIPLTVNIPDDATIFIESDIPVSYSNITYSTDITSVNTLNDTIDEQDLAIMSLSYEQDIAQINNSEEE